jgi:hypothetical protein
MDQSADLRAAYCACSASAENDFVLYNQGELAPTYHRIVFIKLENLEIKHGREGAGSY